MFRPRGPAALSELGTQNPSPALRQIRGPLENSERSLSDSKESNEILARPGEAAVRTGTVAALGNKIRLIGAKEPYASKPQTSAPV